MGSGDLPSYWITGLSYGHRHPLPQVFRGIPPGEPVVFMCHTPDLIESVAPLLPDVYLAGHTHGGQVALPLYGALVTFSKYGKRFESGAFVVGATSLYVTRGIGMEGGPSPRMRFFARPELSILDLVPAETDDGAR